MKNIIALVLVGAVLVFGAIFGIKGTYRVDPGHAGLVYDMRGGLEDKVLGQGYHWAGVFSSVIQYPISTEVAYYTAGAHEGRKSDDSIVIGTRDGKTMKVDAQITYHMDADGLPHIFNKFKGSNSESIEYGYMRQNFQRIANDISSQYTMMDIVGDKKAEFNDKVFKAVYAFFAEDKITVEQAGLGKVEPDDATKAAIQAVANAQYAERQAMYEKAAATAQAQKAVEVAKGNADAKKIEADAEAYRMQKLAQSTDARIVELEWVKKWDGKLPVNVYGDGSKFMLDARSK